MPYLQRIGPHFINLEQITHVEYREDFSHGPVTATITFASGYNTTLYNPRDIAVLLRLTTCDPELTLEKLIAEQRVEPVICNSPSPPP